MKQADFGNGIFAEIPSNWEIHKEDTILLYDPKGGIGALQLSFYDTAGNAPVDIALELESFLEDRHEEVIVEDRQGYAYSEVEEDGVFWRYWLLNINGKVIFISYNSENVYKVKEDPIVDMIVKSIKAD